MSKVVAGKSPKKHYTPVSNALIRNPEIDDSTFRLICWMTSHQEGFEINFNSIQKALNYGRDKLRKIFKTAENQNYLIRRKIRGEGGLFDFEYHIFKDTEDAIAFRESLPQAELTSDLFSGGGSTRGGSTGGGSARGGSTRGGQSTPVYIEEQYKENQKEEEQTQEAPPSPGAPPTQECVCEDESIWDIAAQQAASVEVAYFEELAPKLSASLLKKSESSQQTDNPSSGSSIAAGSFDKVEQPNNDPYKTAQNVEELIDAWITDPITFADDFVPLVVRDKIKWNRWVLPWRSAGRKLNNQYQNFNPIVVDFLAQELATKSKLSAQQEITHAIAVINTWEKNKGGWTNLMQRYHQALKAEQERLARQQTIQATHAAPDDLRTSAVLPQVRLARRFSKTEYRSQESGFRMNAHAAAG